MLFSAVLVNIPNSKDYLKGEWSIPTYGRTILEEKTMRNQKRFWVP